MKPSNKYKHITLLIIIMISISFTISCSNIAHPATTTETSKQVETTQTPNTVEQTTTTQEATTTTEAEIINAPEIAGLSFNQETRKYLNEKGEKVGVYVEDAMKIDGKITNAVGLMPEEIQKILNKNKEKGIFKYPWPFNFQKNKGIEAVELLNNPLHEQKVFKQQGIYLPNDIGVKYSEPIGFYAIFDVNNSMSLFGENIPDEKGSDFYSNQPFKNLCIANKNFGGIQFNFIDWEPEIELSPAKIFGNNEIYIQNILGDIKCGDYLGKILPSAPDFNFLDFINNKEFYGNAGQFQGRLIVSDLSGDYSEKSSSLEKMLKLGKGNQEITVFVWSGENAAHEQTN